MFSSERQTKKAKSPSHRLLSFGIYCLLMIATQCKSGKRHDVAFQFDPDSSKLYHLVFLKRDSNESTGKIDSVSFQASLRFSKTNDSLISLNMMFQDIKFSKRVMIGDFDWNAFFNKSLGYSVNIGMNSSGIVKWIRGYGINFNTYLTTDQNSYGERVIFEDYLGENSLRDDLNRLFSSVRTKMVMPGDIWSSTLILTAKAPVKIASTYTLEQQIGDTAFISLTSVISARQAEGGEFYLEGKQDGEVLINYNTGVPYSYESNSQSNYKTPTYNTVTDEIFKAKIVTN
jgi:Family of unknown function (DUF6263)